MEIGRVTCESPPRGRTAWSGRPARGQHAGFRAAALAALAASSVPSGGATISVPNGSFEMPVTTFVATRIPEWQEEPQPASFTNTQFAWDWHTGVFANTDPSSSNHIPNLDGNQVLYLFAVPGVGLWQDFDTVDWTGTPTHAFDARYEIGKGYRMTIGVIGGGGGMQPGAELRLALTYRDDDGNRAIAAHRDIVHDTSVFPTTTDLVDFTVSMPPVQANDPWAGRQIGILMLSIVDPSLEGGYWDLDHVRLSDYVAPTVVDAELMEGGLRLTLEGDANTRYEILAADDVASLSPASNQVAVVTNVTGMVTVEHPFQMEEKSQFFQVRELP